MPKTNKKKLIEEEISHLKHMETAIIPIFVALAIFGFTLRITEKGIISGTLISYLFGSALILSILHLYHLILKDIRGRIAIFFVDAVFLFILPIVSISVIILYGLFGDMNILINPIPKIIGLAVSVVISTILLLYLIYRKILPAFENKIFPILSKEYKIPKFRYKKQKKEKCQNQKVMIRVCREKNKL